MKQYEMKNLYWHLCMDLNAYLSCSKSLNRTENESKYSSQQKRKTTPPLSYFIFAWSTVQIEGFADQR